MPFTPKEKLLTIGLVTVVVLVSTIFGTLAGLLYTQVFADIAQAQQWILLEDKCVANLIAQGVERVNIDMYHGVCWIKN